jgi:thiamine kinase-like enzyme
MGPVAIADLRSAICGLMPEWSSTALQDFHYLPGGYSNDNYRFTCHGSSYVVRLPLAGNPEPRWRGEKAFFEAPGEVAIPNLVSMDAASGLLICRWVEGELLVQTQPNDEHLIAYLRRLHEALADHSMLTRRRYDPIERAQRYLAAAPRSVPGAIMTQALDLKWPADGITPCHNDLNPWNVVAPMAAPRTWVTLDWECPGQNDPVFDLVTLHQGLGRDMSQIKPLAERLLQSNVPAQRIDLSLRGFWLREYGWAFAAWHTGNRREEIAEQMQHAQGKLQALAH